jgi:uncharacterized membrane protein YoaT (DUF817 family)
MVWTGLETWDELKAVSLFHVVGFALEVFKTSGGIQSWSYPDFAYTKLFGVPLFSGFMYAAVGSYIIQAWRLLDLRIRHHPPYWMAVLIALLIYANFFTHHYIGDYRWYLAACALGLYARTTVVFRPLDRERSMPLLLGFVLVGFFIWLAENISTFWGVWRYPNQMGAWSAVHVSKWSSCAILAGFGMDSSFFGPYVFSSSTYPRPIVGGNGEKMSLGLLGRKVGMMRIFTDDGDSIPVTVLDVSNNRVAQIKTPETDGYSAVQVAFGQRRASRVNKAVAGHHAKLASKLVPAEGIPRRRRQSCRTESWRRQCASLFEVGQKDRRARHLDR